MNDYGLIELLRQFKDLKILEASQEEYSKCLRYEFICSKETLQIIAKAATWIDSVYHPYIVLELHADDFMYILSVLPGRMHEYMCENLKRLMNETPDSF